MGVSEQRMRSRHAWWTDDERKLHGRAAESVRHATESAAVRHAAEPTAKPVWHAETSTAAEPVWNATESVWHAATAARTTDAIESIPVPTATATATTDGPATII